LIFDNGSGYLKAGFGKKEPKKKKKREREKKKE